MELSIEDLQNSPKNMQPEDTEHFLHLAASTFTLSWFILPSLPL